MPDELQPTTTTGEAGDATPAATEAPASQDETTATETPITERFKDFLTKASESDEVKDTPADDTTPKLEDKPKADEKPVETKAERVPDAPDSEDEDEDDDELEVLSKEEVDKRFSNSPKRLRAYAARMGETYGPYKQIVEDLGGVEAVKQLDAMRMIAIGEPDIADNGNVDQFEDLLTKINPSFAEAYRSKLFYSALDPDDGQPETDLRNAETLLNPWIQQRPGFEDMTLSKLVKMAEMVKTGEIDLEEIQEKLDAELDPAEKKRRADEAAKNAERDTRDAETQKRLDVVEAKEKQTSREKDVIDLWGQFAKVVEPVIKKFGLQDFISKDDPEDIKAIKTAYMDDLGNAIGRRLEKNDLFLALSKKIDSQQKGDDYAWLSLKCANIYKGIYREEAAKRAPLLAAYLKSYGSPVKEVTTRRPEPDKDASQANQPSPQAKDKQEDNRATLQEDRRDALARLMVEKEAELSKRASAA